MSELWEDDGFGSAGVADEIVGDDDWDEGEESLETSVEDALDDPEELADDELDDEV